MIRTMIAPALFGLALSAAPLAAQVNANNLVNVNLSNNDIANDIARDLDVNVSQIPVTVQVPVGIAATVCDVQANVLADAKNSGGAACDATSSSQALNKAVQKQMNSQ